MTLFIQVATGDNNGTTAPATLGTNVTAGSFIVASIQTDGAAVTGVTDSLGGHYVFMAGISGASGRTEQWIAFGSAGGACTVTAATGSSTHIIFYAIEYPGSFGTSVIAANQAGAGGVSSSPLVALTGTSNGQLVTAMMCGQFTAQATGNIGSNAAEFVAADFPDILSQDGQSSGGSINVTSTGASANWIACAICIGTLPSVGLLVGGIHYVTA